MELSGKKVIIPVEEMFNTHEFWYPYYRLKEAGCEVVVMGSGRSETFTGKPGTEVKVDLNADQVSASDYDGIVIPGGYAPDLMRRYPKMVQLVRDFYEGRQSRRCDLPCRVDAGLGQDSRGQNRHLIFCHKR